MIPFDRIPLSSFSWFIGALGIFVMGVKSLQSYRRSRVELSKYISWFGLVVGLALFFFSVPSFFTANIHILFKFDVIGEALFYASMIAQAAIVWCLILRSRLSVYALTVPVGIISFVSWVYAARHARVYFSAKNFITYLDPRFSTLVIAFLMIFLFVPVGIYFLSLASKQSNFKAKLNSIGLGLVYVGIGLINGGFEIATGQVMTRTSALGISLFFTILLIISLWPRRAGKPTVQILSAASGPAAPNSAAATPPPPAPKPTPDDGGVIGPPPPGPPAAEPQDGQPAPDSQPITSDEQKPPESSNNFTAPQGQ